MTDLITRMRHAADYADVSPIRPSLVNEAADRIEALEAENREIRSDYSQRFAAFAPSIAARDAVIAEADERLHAASIPLGMSELAFARATIREVHAILAAARVWQGAAQP